MILATRMTELVNWHHGSVHVNYWLLVLVLLLAIFRLVAVLSLMASRP